MMSEQNPHGSDGIESHVCYLQRYKIGPHDQTLSTNLFSLPCDIVIYTIFVLVHLLCPPGHHPHSFQKVKMVEPLERDSTVMMYIYVPPLRGACSCLLVIQWDACHVYW